MKIDWKTKLSSRKFWAAVTAWLTSLLAALKVSDSITAVIILVASGIGSLAVYMLSEAIVDARRAETNDVQEMSIKYKNNSEE